MVTSSLMFPVVRSRSAGNPSSRNRASSIDAYHDYVKLAASARDAAKAVDDMKAADDRAEKAASAKLHTLKSGSAAYKAQQQVIDALKASDEKQQTAAQKAADSASKNADKAKQTWSDLKAVADDARYSAA